MAHFQLQPLTATTAELEDAASVVNAVAQKTAGFQVWNSTTNIPVWASGSAADSVWVDSTGATLHTPV